MEVKDHLFMKVYLLTCTLKGSSQRFRTECMCENRSGWMDGWWKRCSRQVSDDDDDDAHPRKQADCDPFVNFMKHHYKPYIVSQHANNSNKILTRLESAVCCIIHLLLCSVWGKIIISGHLNENRLEPDPISALTCIATKCLSHNFESIKFFLNDGG